MIDPVFSAGIRIYDLLIYILLSFALAADSIVQLFSVNLHWIKAFLLAVQNILTNQSTHNKSNVPTKL